MDHLCQLVILLPSGTESFKKKSSNIYNNSENTIMCQVIGIQYMRIAVT